MVKIQFFGDISYDGFHCSPANIPAVRRNHREISALLGDYDFRFGNWECPLVGDLETNPRKEKRAVLLTTELAAQSVLSFHLTAVTLANNHIYDGNLSGAQATLAFFEKHSIGCLGVGFSSEEAAAPFLFEKEGISFALLNYIGPEKKVIENIGLPDKSPLHVNVLEPDRVLQDIRQWKRNVDHVIVCCHWGDRDISFEPPLEHRFLGRSMVNAGASLIYGGQCHIQLSYEYWDECPIMYSLGNFIFCMTTLAHGNFHYTPLSAVRKIGIPTVEFSKDTVKIVSWKYLVQPDTSLLLEEDFSPDRLQKHIYFNGRLKEDDEMIKRMSPILS